MAETTFYIRIKKNYASDIIKDLQKLDAVELLEAPPVPDWQKKEVRKRVKDLQKIRVKLLVGMMQQRRLSTWLNEKYKIIFSSDSLNDADATVSIMKKCNQD